MREPIKLRVRTVFQQQELPMAKAVELFVDMKGAVDVGLCDWVDLEAQQLTLGGERVWMPLRTHPEMPF